MLYQKKSGSSARFKYLAVLPLLGSMLCMSTLAFTKSYGWVDLVPQLLLTATQTHGTRYATYDAKNISIGLVVKQALAPAETSVKADQANAAHQAATAQAQQVSKQTINAKVRADTDLVEINPSFPGGEGAFGRFLARNVRYPKSARDASVSGRVFVQFFVETDGSLGDMTVLREPGAGLGEEALRVLKLSPKWMPALQNGKPVRVKYTVPVTFSLAPPTPVSGNPPTGATPPVTQDANAQPIFSAVQINPSFPGGEEAFRRFLIENVRYPKTAKDANVTGRVFIQFVVETDGSLTDLKILRDPGAGLGDEGLRVLKLSPKWNPGVQNGKPVRVQYTVPINFSLAK